MSSSSSIESDTESASTVSSFSDEAPNIGKEITGYVFNKLYNDKFIKLTNENEIHNNFHFVDGLNIDTQKFNPTRSHSKGGIYFTKKKKAWMWLKYNNQIMMNMRTVTIPDDARVYVEKNKFKADKIILGPKKEITKAIYTKGISYYAFSLAYVPEHLKDRELCLDSVKSNAYELKFVPETIIDQEICVEAVNRNKKVIMYIPTTLKSVKVTESGTLICVYNN